MSSNISQEDRTQPNINVRQRLKWTKTMNKDVIRCFYNTTLRLPDEPYRKSFYRKWKELYPNDTISEQRICDQRTQIIKRAEGNINVRGNWLTQLEIEQIKNEIAQQIEVEADRNENNNVIINENNEINQITNETNEIIREEYINIEVQREAQNNEINENNNINNQETIEIRNKLTENYFESLLTPFERRCMFKRPGKKSEKKLENAYKKVNEAIENFALLTEINDVTQLNSFIYASAMTAIRNAGLEKQCIASNKKNEKNKKKDWEFQMNRRINEIRTDINKIKQINLPSPSPKVKKNSNSMKNKYKMKNNEDQIVTLEKLKQRLKALNNRLTRYTRRQKQYRQNNEFINMPSRLYDEIRGNKNIVKEPPTRENISNFWQPMYETKKHFNKKATWLPKYVKFTENINQATYTSITPNEIAESTSKFANWKSPGIDKLQNFWWKKLTNIHGKTASLIDNTVQNPYTIPSWLTTGRTTLISKKPDTKNPSNYRPITCLPIIYKILTSIITSRMSHHIEAYNIIPPEQKGNASNTYGTIDQLIINKMILEDAKKKKRNISTAWIDYKKAFDSIPHDWMIEVLKIHKFDQTIIQFFEQTMKTWKTSLHLRHENGEITTNEFNIKTGIFQGDSPSGLIFILCLVPLSWLLKQTKLGYQISRTPKVNISHLLFMDDLKLYAANDAQLENLINVVKIFSDDIKMSFGLEKCNKLTIIKGRIKETNDIKLENGDVLKELDTNQQYRYLGFNERQTTDKHTKTSIKTEYFKRIKLIMKSELNSKNTIDAINAYAVPSLSYGFPILDWTITELEIIDRETRKMLQNYQTMHNQSDINRLYLPRRNGGRGLINITNHYKNAIINFCIYLLQSDEKLLQLVSDWQLTRGEKSIHIKSQNYCAELGIELEAIKEIPKQQRKANIKSKQITKNVNELNIKPTHGQFMRLLQEPHIDHKASNQWLKSSELKRATESTICAIQEQAITTKYIKKHIHHSIDDDQCRLCKNEKETIHHIISGCTTLAPTKYLQRHDNLCKYIHILLLQKHQHHAEQTKWYKHDPSPIYENETSKILWNFSIQTDHRINHNKPDIIVLDKVKNVALIIDVAIPNDYNIARKRFEKLRNYTDLAIEIKTLWNLTNVKIIPIIIGATGTFYNDFDKEIQKMDIEDIFKKTEAQKIVLLGTTHIVRSFLQIT